MDRQSRSKLNQLLKNLPQGTVAVQAWLDSREIYRQLTGAYAKSAWLKRIGRGAYIRDGETVDWTGGLYAVQAQMQLAVHAGAKTALQMQGATHYLALGDQGSLFLFGAPGIRLPAWFKAHNWEKKLQYTATGLFQEYPLGLAAKNLGAYAITISSTERAIMEMLHFVPGVESFREAEQIMAGLTTLRPDLVQALLESCNSLKVKRLFMYLTEKSGHRWIKQLDLTKVIFGTGKRMIVRGGRLDRQYQITVPHDDADGITVPAL